jgi:hypothetical protein
VRGTSKLTDADRHAIAVYLKSVAPIHVDLPPKAKVVSDSRAASVSPELSRGLR